MNYKNFGLCDWIDHINDAIEDERALDGNEMRDLAEFLSKEALKAEPCGDAVRRETVRDMFCELHCHSERSKCVFRNICKYMNRVSALPPATPLPNKIDGMLEDAYEHGYQQARYDYEVQPCEDAIDRRALRAQFNHLDEVYEEMSEEEKHEAYIYGQIIRAIDDAPPVAPKQEWIHVSEDLPKESDEYLVSVIDEYDENYEAVGVARYDVEEGEWQELGVDRTVIAWMPKPATYKEGERE